MHCRLSDNLTGDEAAELDAFLSHCDAAAHMQRVIWPEIAAASRLHRFRYLTCHEDGRILLAGIVRFTQLFPGYHLAALFRGPVFSEISHLDRCLPHVHGLFKDTGAIAVLANPMWADEGADRVSAVLASHRFRPISRVNDPMYRLTGYVDLSPPEDEIFASLKYRCRRHIRGAAKKGLVVRPARDAADVERFRSLLAEFKVYKDLDLDGWPDLVDQWRYVGAHGGVFHLAEFESQLIGGHVAFGEGKRAALKTLASLPGLPQIPRSYNLIWEAIRDLKRQGFTELDLGGLDERTLYGDQASGREFFKLAFNPRIARLVPLHVCALRPVPYTLLFHARQAYRRAGIRRIIGPMMRSLRHRNG